MDAAESILHAGDRLDRYELLCPIASGGMATVWLARLRGKRGFEKLFAIKTIRTELVDDATFQEMFLDEARIASRIQHPHVAQILDLGEQGDALFIVMEWVDGDSLAKIRKHLAITDSRLPIGITLRLLADTCAGLHAAHELRDEEGNSVDLVHRDVSPQNILVSVVGAAKVIDFGIAKAHGRSQGETKTGVVKGKIQYLAPEQVKKGMTIDRRTDIWALGACLQELVTGKLPYDGEDDVEVIRKLMTDEPPPAVEGLPTVVANVLGRSMALDPAARFPTAAAMHRALEAALKELGDSTTNDDVAAFLRKACPELAQKRKRILGKAIDDARTRPVPESKDEVAFAPTLVGATSGARPLRTSDVGTVAVVKRKGDTPARPAVEASSDLDDEPIVIPKRSVAWLWILLLLGGGVGFGAYRYPAMAHRALVAVGLGGDGSQSTAAPGTVSVVPPVVAAISSAAPPASHAAAMASSAGSSAPSSSATASPSSASMAAAAASASAAGAASISHVVWTAHHPEALPAVPDEPSAAPEPTSSTPWSIYKSSPPSPPTASATASAPAPAPAPAAPAASRTPGGPNDSNPY